MDLRAGIARMNIGASLAIGAMLSILALPKAASCDELVVFATSSAAAAVVEATQSFASESSIGVRVEAGSPGVLVGRLLAGETAHVVVLDGGRWMGELAERRLIAPGTRHRLCSNRLVLVTHRDVPLSIAIEPNMPLYQLLGDDRLAIADPEVDPAGKLALEALEKLGVLPSVRSKLTRAPDVHAALHLAALKEGVIAAIVYATEARSTREVNLQGIFLPTLHPPIVYEIGIVASRATPQAKKLLSFMLSDRAKEKFAARGFLLGRVVLGER